MAVKPGANDCIVKEQIIEDINSGLSFQFLFVPEDEITPIRLRVFGNIPHGNREILFDPSGVAVGSGTSLQGNHWPSWVREVKRA